MSTKVFPAHPGIGYAPLWQARRAGRRVSICEEKRVASVAHFLSLFDLGPRLLMLGSRLPRGGSGVHRIGSCCRDAQMYDGAGFQGGLKKLGLAARGRCACGDMKNIINEKENQHVEFGQQRFGGDCFDSPNSTSAEGAMPLKPSSRKEAAVQEVFDYWREQCGHPRARLGADRRMRIKARFAEGYTVTEIKRAIDNAAKYAFVSEQGKRFDDIELICRSSVKLESFIERMATPRSRRENASDWLREINGAP